MTVVFTVFQLISAVGGVREAVSVRRDGYSERFPPPPLDMDQLHISGKYRKHRPCR